MLKKFFLILSCCFCVCVSAFAQQKYLGYIRSGEFAYFIDSRYKTPYARGYLVLHYSQDETYVLSSTVDLDSGKRWTMNFFVALDDNETISITSIAGLNDVPDEERNNVFQTAIDFLNYAEMRFANEAKITEGCVLEDPWSDDFSLWYHFSSAVPFFGFTEITNAKNSTEPLMEAHCFGIVSSLEPEVLDAFYNMEIVPFTETERNSGSIPPKAKKMTVTMNGFSVALDENWTKNSFEGTDSYWLSIQSYRESQITVEKLPATVPSATNEQKIAIANIIILSSDGIIPASITVRFDKKDLILEYESYDQYNWVTYTCIRIKDGYLVNFSSYKDVYEANKKYFETILKSVKQK